MANEPKSRAAEVKQERRRRADTGENAGLKLHVPEGMKEKGYVYRWINDKASGRIQNMTVGDDWDIVKTPAINGDGDGTPVTRNVGTGEHGQPMRAYLCRKPEQFYQEDQAAKQRPIIEQEEAMRRGPLPNSSGLSTTEAYVPSGHKNVIGRQP